MSGSRAFPVMRLILIGVALSQLLAAGGTRAATVAVGFSGTVTDVIDNLGLSISPGVSMTGGYTFDTGAPDSDPDPAVGVYPLTEAPASIFALIFPDLLLQSLDPLFFPITITVFDDLPEGDAYAVGHDGLVTLDFTFSARFILLALEPTNTRAGDSLPALPPDLSGPAAQATFELTVCPLVAIFCDPLTSPPGARISGSIDHFFVPEPSRALSTFAALVALAALRTFSAAGRAQKTRAKIRRCTPASCSPRSLGSATSLNWRAQ